MHENDNKVETLTCLINCAKMYIYSSIQVTIQSNGTSDLKCTLFSEMPHHFRDVFPSLEKSKDIFVQFL